MFCGQVSFIEIYQDDIRDLLGEGGDGYVPISVRESPDRGTFLDNVQCVPLFCLNLYGICLEERMGEYESTAPHARQLTCKRHGGHGHGCGLISQGHRWSG